MSRQRCAHRRHGHRHGGSLVARVFALLLAGLLAAALLTGGVAWWWGRESGLIGPPEPAAWAARVAALVQALDAAPPANRAPLWALAEPGGLAPLALPSEPDAERDPPREAALALALGREARVWEAHDRRACALHDDDRGPGRRHCRLARVALADGSVLMLRVIEPVTAWPGWTERMRGHGRGGWLIPLALGLALLALAGAITRLALAPTAVLVRGAERFADDVDAPPLPERGPREIRGALAAFNRMQARIRAHLAERTSMLAAIAHDLQTPLTRLRLRLEQVADEGLRRQLAADLDECRQRVGEGLEFARSLDERRPLVDVDLDALLASACAEAQDAGGDVAPAPPAGLTVRAEPRALLRCVENLLSNALKYGGRAEVSARRDGDEAVIVIRDHGPGIPPADLERVFEPFVRLEPSRSRETGGTGLGLAIVRNLMRRQQGRVSLANRDPAEGGGLAAELRIPIAIASAAGTAGAAR